MDAPTRDLADLIAEFLALAGEPEARASLESQARDLGVGLDEFLAMSLTHLILQRFRLLPRKEEGPVPDDADGPDLGSIDLATDS